MPQLELGFYLSQMLFYFGAFGVMFLVVSFVIYPRIDAIIEERERVLMNKSEETDRIVARAEEIRKKIEIRRIELRKKLDALSVDYRSRAGIKFEQIVAKANRDFELAIHEGMKSVKAEVDRYKIELDALVGSLKGDVLRSVMTNSANLLDHSRPRV